MAAGDTHQWLRSGSAGNELDRDAEQCWARTGTGGISTRQGFGDCQLHLEWATPAPASLCVPLLLAVTFGRPLFRAVTSVVRRVPRTGVDTLDSVLGTFSMQPEEIAALLHGILVGPVAPEIEDRRAISVPTLIIGHEHDLIHPFSDAENLAEQIPQAPLVQDRSMVELRLFPERLTREITSFLDEAVGKPEPMRAAPAGR